MDVDDYLDGTTVTVRDDTYAVVKSHRPYPEAFATLNDESETTVVIESGEYDTEDVIEVEEGWRLLTFDVVLPFDLVGFLARVATALAEANLSIFALSAFSTDHILVDDADLERAIEVLENLGCSVERASQ